ncbi:OmpA family protein [Actinosynnema sp. NPDC059797]
MRADEVLLVGEARDDAERTGLVDAVRGQVGPYRVTDLIDPNGGRVPAAHDDVVDLLVAAVGSGAVGLTAEFRGERVDVAAVVPDERAAEVLRQSVRRVASVGDVNVGVRAPNGGPPDVGALQRSVTAMVQRNGGFRFEPGTTDWQGHGPVLVNRVGRLLLAAPASTITLVGHASAESPDAHDLASTRAGMVRDLFAAQGVRPDRIETSVSVDTAPENSDPAARQVDVLIS